MAIVYKNTSTGSIYNTHVDIRADIGDSSWPDTLDDVFLNEKGVVVYDTALDLSTSVLRTRLLRKLSEYRYEHECGYDTYDSSREARTALKEVQQRLESNPGSTANYKNSGSWVTLDLAQVNSILTEIGDFVQGCFDNEKSLHDQLMSCATNEELLAVDLTSGWPATSN